MEQNSFCKKMKKPILTLITSLIILMASFLLTVAIYSAQTSNRSKPQPQQAASSSVFDFDNATEIKTGVWQIPNFSNYQEFHISSPKGLEIFASIVNHENGGASGYDSFKGEKVCLTTDIHYKNPITINIGDVVGGNNHIFLGNFDGENHTISNIIIGTKSYNASSSLVRFEDSSGFFTYFRGELKNLNLAKVTWGGAKVYNAAGLVGYIDSAQINNCSISEFEAEVWAPSIYDGHTDVAGLIGYAAGSYSITDCKVSNVIFTGIGDCSGLIACTNEGDGLIVGCEVSDSTFTGAFCCGITGDSAYRNLPDSITIQECAIKNVTLNDSASYGIGSSGLVAFQHYVPMTISDVFIDINPESNFATLVGVYISGVCKNVVIKTSDTSRRITDGNGEVTLDNVVKTKDWSNFNVNSVGGEGTQLSKWYNGGDYWNDGWIYPRRLIEWKDVKFKSSNTEAGTIGGSSSIQIPKDVTDLERYECSTTTINVCNQISSVSINDEKFLVKDWVWSKLSGIDTFTVYFVIETIKIKFIQDSSTKACEIMYKMKVKRSGASDISYIGPISELPQNGFIIGKGAKVKFEMKLCGESLRTQKASNGLNFYVYNTITITFSRYNSASALNTKTEDVELTLYIPSNKIAVLGIMTTVDYAKPGECDTSQHGSGIKTFNFVTLQKKYNINIQ